MLSSARNTLLFGGHARTKRQLSFGMAYSLVVGAG